MLSSVPKPLVVRLVVLQPLAGLATILKYICHLLVQLFLKPLVVVEEGNPLTAAAILALVAVEEAQVAQEPQAQIIKPPRLMLAVTEETQRLRVHHGLAELLVRH